MSIFEQLKREAGGLDVSAIARQVGLTPEQVEQGAGQLMPQLADPDVDNHQATAEVAARTGIPYEALIAMIPSILTQVRGAPGGADSGALGQIMAGISGGAGSSGGGLFGGLSGMLDRDGDGNPINDVMGYFTRK